MTLGNGEILTADLVVGADGCSSRVRDVVLEEEDRPEPSGMSFYTGAASAEDVRSDPELGRYLQNEEVSAHRETARRNLLRHVRSGRSGWGTVQAYMVGIAILFSEFYDSLFSTGSYCSGTFCCMID